MLAVTEARVLVGLQSDDTSRDARLQQLIAAAYEQAAHFCGPLEQTIVTETVPARAGQLILSHPPVARITSVTGLDVVTGLVVDARTGLVTGLPSSIGYSAWGWGGWAPGSGAGSVTVTYLSGYDAIPASIEEGVRAWVKHRWLQESYGTDTYGTDAVSAAVTDFDGLPNAVRNAWRPFLLDSTGGIA